MSFEDLYGQVWTSKDSFFINRSIYSELATAYLVKLVVLLLIMWLWLEERVKIPVVPSLFAVVVCSFAFCFFTLSLELLLLLCLKVKTEHETENQLGSRSSPMPALADSVAVSPEPADLPTNVTLTHFQESESGTLEKAVVGESNNPFLVSATSAPLQPLSCVRNPFVDEVQANNPFLSRLSSPVAPIRPLSPSIVNESFSSADSSQTNTVCVLFFMS